MAKLTYAEDRPPVFDDYAGISRAAERIAYSRAASDGIQREDVLNPC